MPEEFGYKTAPDISGAERESVSTDENSALQRAIRSTQGSEGFIKDPSDLLAMGPRAFDIAREGEKERRDMLVSRASQGIALSGQALSQRGFQKKTDSRRALEQEAEAFFRRTDGMSSSEALGDASSSEGRNPIIAPSFTALDAARIKAGTAEAALDEQGVDRDARLPRDERVATKVVENTLHATGVGDMTSVLNNIDLKNKQAVAQAVVGAGITDRTVGMALAKQLEDNPKRTMGILNSLGVFSTNISKSVAAGWGDEAWKALSARAILSVTSEVDDPGLNYDLALAGAQAAKFLNEQDAKKVAEERLLPSEKTQLKINALYVNLNLATKSLEDGMANVRPEVEANILGLKAEIEEHNKLKKTQRKEEKAAAEKAAAEKADLAPATTPVPTPTPDPVVPTPAPATTPAPVPANGNKNKAASEVMGLTYKG